MVEGAGIPEMKKVDTTKEYSDDELRQLVSPFDIGRYLVKSSRDKRIEHLVDLLGKRGPECDCEWCQMVTKPRQKKDRRTIIYPEGTSVHNQCKHIYLVNEYRGRFM